MIELNKEQKKQLKAVAEKYGLRFIIAHGSYVTGKEHKGSDLDVAVLGRDPHLLREKIFELHNDFADIFGDGPERDLDLKTLHGTDSLFRYLVIRDGVLLCGNLTDYEEYKAYAFRDYMDSKDLRDLEMQMTLAKQAILTKLYAG
jgi:uncharacterized protein